VPAAEIAFHPARLAGEGALHVAPEGAKGILAQFEEEAVAARVVVNPEEKVILARLQSKVDAVLVAAEAARHVAREELFAVEPELEAVVATERRRDGDRFASLNPSKEEGRRVIDFGKGVGLAVDEARFLAPEPLAVSAAPVEIDAPDREGFGRKGVLFQGGRDVPRRGAESLLALPGAIEIARGGHRLRPTLPSREEGRIVGGGDGRERKHGDQKEHTASCCSRGHPILQFVLAP